MRGIDRVGAFSGVAYVLFALIGSQIAGAASAGGTSPGRQILDDQQAIAAGPWFRLALAMIMLSYVAFLVFVAYLHSVIRDAGWPATAALIGGAATLILNIAGAASTFAVFVLRDALSPGLARALIDVDGAGRMLALVTAGAFVLFASAAALTTRTLGRVMSWAGIAIGAASILFMILTPPFTGTDDEFFGWPLLLVLLWMAVVSVRLGFTRGSGVRARTVPAPAV